MSDKTKKWIKAAGVRAVKTMAQTAVSLIIVGNLITELDWVSIIGIFCNTGVVSMLQVLQDCRKWKVRKNNEQNT